MTQPTVPIDLPLKLKPRRGKPKQDNDDDEVTRIPINMDDFEPDQVRLIDRPLLQQIISKAQEELEKADKEGVELVGEDKWYETVRNTKNGEPPEKIGEYEMPDPDDKQKPNDAELRVSARYHIWFEKAVRNALQQLREAQDTVLESSEDEVGEKMEKMDVLLEDEDEDDEPPGRGRGRRGRK